MNLDRFESYPVWNYKRNGDPTMDQLHTLNKQRRAVRRRDRKRDRMITTQILHERILRISTMLASL